MKRVSLPTPPNPDDAQYKNTLTYHRALYQWGMKVKGLIEDTTRVNSSPCGQQILTTNFSTNTVISGTSTGTDLANFVATLAQTLTSKGILSPNVTIGDTQ